MNIKRKKFYNLIEFLKIFNQYNKGLYLFCHVNNYNLLENNQIKFYCESNNIKTKYVKIGLLKKLTKNALLRNILVGPTQVFFFNDIKTFYQFLQITFLKKKFYPLSVYFNNTFYNYKFFNIYIDKKISNILENNYLVYYDFFYSMIHFHKMLLGNLKYVICNFIFFLGVILNNFKI